MDGKANHLIHQSLRRGIDRRVLRDLGEDVCQRRQACFTQEQAFHRKPRARQQDVQWNFTFNNEPPIRTARQIALAHTNKRGDPWIAPVGYLDEI